MADQDILKRLSDLEDIRQLKARYCRYLDLRQWAEWRALFTDDADCSSPGVRAALGEGFGGGVDDFVTYVKETQDARDQAYGRAAASGASAPVLTGIHHVHAPEIEFTGPDKARAIWRLSTLHPPSVARPGAGSVVFGYGLYYDECRREAQGWKFTSVKLVLLREDEVPSEVHFRLRDELQIPWTF